MLKELYLRDITDPKYKPYIMETSNPIEVLLNKIRMILYTNRGEVMGEPDMGMDLEDYLFQFNVNEAEIKNRFNSQVALYIPESNEFKISLDINVESDGSQNIVYLYINIDGIRYMGLQI